MTWAEMAKIEPRLKDLLKQAQDYKRESKKEEVVCANQALVSWIKPQLTRLVGWDSPHKELQSHLEFDVAFRTIYGALPDCRGCGCM